MTAQAVASGLNVPASEYPKPPSGSSRNTIAFTARCSALISLLTWDVALVVIEAILYIVFPLKEKTFSSETGSEDLQASRLFFHGLDTSVTTAAALYRPADCKQDDRNGDEENAYYHINNDRVAQVHDITLAVIPFLLLCKPLENHVGSQ
jgi:hypothetical protein